LLVAVVAVARLSAVVAVAVMFEQETSQPLQSKHIQLLLALVAQVDMTVKTDHILVVFLVITQASQQLVFLSQPMAAVVAVVTMVAVQALVVVRVVVRVQVVVLL
jgi:hypothetical protein